MHILRSVRVRCRDAYRLVPRRGLHPWAAARFVVEAGARFEAKRPGGFLNFSRTSCGSSTRTYQVEVAFARADRTEDARSLADAPCAYGAVGALRPSPRASRDTPLPGRRSRRRGVGRGRARRRRGSCSHIREKNDGAREYRGDPAGGARGPPRDVGCPRGFSADRRGRLARLDARGTAARRGAATCPPRSRPLPAAPPGHHREPRRLPRRQRGDSHERRRVRGLPRGHLRQRSHRRLHLPRHAPQLRPQRGVQHQVQSHRVRVQVLRRPGPRLRRQRRAQHHGGAVRFRRGRRSAHLRRRGLLLLRRHRFHPLRSQRLDRR